MKHPKIFRKVLIIVYLTLPRVENLISYLRPLPKLEAFNGKYINKRKVTFLLNGRNASANNQPRLIIRSCS